MGDEVQDQAETRAAAWALFGTMVGFKIVTIALIMIMVPSAHVFMFMFLMNWYVLVFIGAVLAIPGVYWYRLIRARAKRAQLHRQEWCLDENAIEDVPKSVRPQYPGSAD